MVAAEVAWQAQCSCMGVESCMGGVAGGVAWEVGRRRSGGSCVGGVAWEVLRGRSVAWEEAQWEEVAVRSVGYARFRLQRYRVATASCSCVGAAAWRSWSSFRRFPGYCFVGTVVDIVRRIGTGFHGGQYLGLSHTPQVESSRLWSISSSSLFIL